MASGLLTLILRIHLFWGIIRNLESGPFDHTMENITV